MLFPFTKNFKERLTLAEGFSKKNKDIELAKIRKIVQCSSEEEVDKIVETLENKIKLYFLKNWRGILNEFVDELRPVKICLGIRTTCWCENFFKNLKAFITKNNSFEGFLIDIYDFIIKRRSDHGNEMKKIYLKVSNNLFTNKLSPARIFLTSFAFEYVTLILSESVNIIVPNGVNFIKCNFCDWDVKIGLPYLHQLSSFDDIKQIRNLVKRRWEKDNLFNCYGILYNNRELYLLDNTEIQVKDTNEIRGHETLEKTNEINSKEIKELEKYSNVISWNHLTELSTKINSFFYNGDNTLKIKGETTLETIMTILETSGADELLEILRK